MSAGIRCDVCGQFAEHEDARDWMTLAQADQPSSSGFFALGYTSPPKVAHICSWACLGLLAIKQDVDLEVAQ